jgi:thymidine kinase
MASTRIEIILGCMYSGKSTELLRRCARYKAIGKKILLINHALDVRTGNSVMTHRKETVDAIKTDKLLDILNKDDFIKSDVVGIDEGQFFEDLLEFIKLAESSNKIIIISGLDGDSERKPFGQILECIPYCDEVVKLNAMDMVDKDGTPGIFTKRVSKKKDRILVGTTDCFIAVSRKNYLSEQNTK